MSVTHARRWQAANVLGMRHRLMFVRCARSSKDILRCDVDNDADRLVGPFGTGHRANSGSSIARRLTSTSLKACNKNPRRPGCRVWQYGASVVPPTAMCWSAYY